MAKTLKGGASWEVIRYVRVCSFLAFGINPSIKKLGKLRVNPEREVCLEIKKEQCM
jgi:sulfur relay (sulfurtransferase) DsrC/TusE family protein